jgi:hypothetical protein
MRKYLITVLALLMCTSAAVQAGIPDPTRSGCELKGQNVPCQYRFRHDGGIDRMTLCVTLRDIFDVPVAAESTTATLVDTDNGSLCTCCPNPQSGFTDAGGVVIFEFKKLGGRGSGEVRVTSRTTGNIAICQAPFDFTSTDLDGDCLDTDVVDLGLFANCLPPGPYCRTSDYNCDATVDVIDLGLWAGGLGLDCSSGAPCP